MASVTITHPVVIKAIVTEKLKEELIAELTQRAQHVEAEVQQLEEYKNRTYSEIAKTDIQRAMALRRQVEAAKRQKEREKEETDQLIADVRGLADGEEVVRDVLEGVAEVKVGDNLREIRSREIVVKDDVVTDIRVAESPPRVAPRLATPQSQATPGPQSPITLVE